jgi:hypothetical protein
MQFFRILLYNLILNNVLLSTAAAFIPRQTSMGFLPERIVRTKLWLPFRCFLGILKQ